MTRWIRRTTVVMVAAVLSGCGIGYKDLPLPGSKVRGEVYSVAASFDQALNLAQGAPVRLNGVSIGRVTSVQAKNYRAHVTMDIRSATTIPADSSARLRYDTPLGELIIQINPGDSPSNLADGGQFDADKATTAPSVEDSLQAASTLINGGNLGELQVLATELNAAFGGREREIRESTEQLTEFLTEANASSRDITATLEALSSVSRTLNEQRGTIRKTLDDLGPAVKTLGEDTDEFVDFLQDADTLALRAQRIALQVKDPFIEILMKLGPIADMILSTRSEFRTGLDGLIAVSAQINKTIPNETLPLIAVFNLDQTVVGSASAAAPASQSAPRAKTPAGLVKAPTGLPIDLVKGTTDSLIDGPSLVRNLTRLLGGER